MNNKELLVRAIEMLLQINITGSQAFTFADALRLIDQVAQNMPEENEENIA